MSSLGLEAWKKVRGAAFVSALVLVESIQAVIALAWAFNFIHFPSVFDKSFFPERLNLTGHGAFSWWTIVFVVIAVGVQAGAVCFLATRVKSAEFRRHLKKFFVVESLITFLLLSALFKMIVYDDRPQLATYCYHALLAVALLNKIFWPFLRTFAAQVYKFLTDALNTVILKKIFTFIFFAVVFIILFIPYPEAALARLFIGEQFHHWDSAVTGPTWAYASGCVLNIDIISRYGVGWPVILAQLTKIFGGVSYLNILQAMVWVVVVYYLLWFAFLRQWFQSLFIAAATILTAIRVQMFHTGDYPLVFHYPSGTAMRFCFDIFFMWMIFWHLKNPRPIFLWMAGAICGTAAFHLTAEGLYLTLAFYFYLTAHLLNPRTRASVCPSIQRIPALIGYFLLPVIVFLGALYMVEGKYILGREYWQNLGEFMNFFLSGFGDNPIYQSLRSKLYLQSLMGFLYPLVYVLTLIIVASQWFLRKAAHQDIFVAMLCVYGLGLYHYYVTLSMWTSYYMNGLPFIFVCGWWVDVWVRQFSIDHRRRIIIIIFALSAYALLTNHNFISYPNLINFSRNPMVDPLVAQPLPNRKPYFNHLFYEYPNAYKLPVNSLGEVEENLKFEKDFATDEELVAYFRKETDFSKDVALITRLTGPKEAVALLSSFEVMMLMQAKRKPFFYYCPIINSRPLKMRNFVVTGMYTTDHLKKTLKQMEDSKPRYVFMERILMSSPVPAAYFYDSPGLFELLNYVFQGYEPVEAGQYLVAWKRKSAP